MGITAKLLKSKEQRENVWTCSNKTGMDWILWIYCWYPESSHPTEHYVKPGHASKSLFFYKSTHSCTVRHVDTNYNFLLLFTGSFFVYDVQHVLKLLMDNKNLYNQLHHYVVCPVLINCWLFLLVLHHVLVYCKACIAASPCGIPMCIAILALNNLVYSRQFLHCITMWYILMDCNYTNSIVICDVFILLTSHTFGVILT